MHQILQMNGLHMADLGERYEVVFHALLKDAAEFHGYAQTSIDHEVPELRKWWYTFVDQQVLHSRKEKTSFSQSVDGATVKAALTTLNPIDLVSIRIENPNKHQLQQQITVLRSAKSAVDKMVSQAEDLLFDVIAKEGAAPKGTLTEQLETAMNGLKKSTRVNAVHPTLQRHRGRGAMRKGVGRSRSFYQGWHYAPGWFQGDV
jgi:hypothetical protein